MHNQCRITGKIGLNVKSGLGVFISNAPATGISRKSLKNNSLQILAVDSAYQFNTPSHKNLNSEYWQYKFKWRNNSNWHFRPESVRLPFIKLQESLNGEGAVETVQGEDRGIVDDKFPDSIRA